MIWTKVAGNLVDGNNATLIALDEISCIESFVSIYLDPTSVHIGFKFQECFIQESVLVIFDLMGREIYRTFIQTTSMEVVLSMDGFSEGLYHYSIVNSQRSLSG